MSNRLPRTAFPDQTLAFLREGYTFISRRCEQMDTDAFRTRLLLRPVMCMRGEDAAALFYQHDAFTRRGAIPPTTLRLLQGPGSVQTLDGSVHMLRRQLFLTLLGPSGAERLAAEFEQVWDARSQDWKSATRVQLDSLLPEMLAEAALRWLGLHPHREGLTDRTEEAVAMVRDAAALGPRLPRALWLRRRCEHWAERLIRDLRRQPRSDTPAAEIAHATAEDGRPLSVHVAALELINILRPVVAVWVFGVFVAMSLHRFPRYRSWLAEWDDPDRVRAFVHEVRRYWPFFPAVGGIAQRDLIWRGHAVPEGTWVLLDLYGTNHHPEIWQHPHQFRPERFMGQAPGLNRLIPQGGGDPRRSHRCPGEGVTVQLMESLARRLATLRWHAPEQNLSLDLTRMPVLPPDGMILEVEEEAARINPPAPPREKGSPPASERPRH